jgi:hypothetical protein
MASSAFYTQRSIRGGRTCRSIAWAGDRTIVEVGSWSEITMADMIGGTVREKVLHGVRILSASLLMAANLALLQAQASDRTIGQFVHTAWSAKEGAPGEVYALAQTTDGFLWLGTMQGLYRFDGVSFERMSPGPDLHFRPPRSRPCCLSPTEICGSAIAIKVGAGSETE